MGSGVWRQALYRKEGAVAGLFRLRPGPGSEAGSSGGAGSAEGADKGSGGGDGTGTESWPLVCVVSTHIWFDPQTPQLKVAQVRQAWLAEDVKYMFGQ